MIILKDECKKIGLSVGDFIALTPVPNQTLRDWCRTKPTLVRHLLLTQELLSNVNTLKDELSQFEIVKTALINAEKHNDFLLEKIKELKKNNTDKHLQKDLFNG